MSNDVAEAFRRAVASRSKKAESKMPEWTKVVIPAGKTESEEIKFDPAKQDLAVKGMLYASDGKTKLRGPQRAKPSVAETTEGGVVTIKDAQGEDTIALVKVVDEEEDELTEVEAETETTEQ